VPPAGTIVDLGCGHGLFANLLAERSAERRVIGIDPDERKIAVAKLTERDGVRFEVGDATTYALPACDAVTVIDVLYLLPELDQVRVIANAARALRPGGVLVVYGQERRADPRFWMGYAQELLATGLGITKGGSGLHYARRAEMRERMEGAGLAVEVMPLPGRLYTDAIFVGRRG
jgi:2-polyprenyl-3-methyl-5-hydroxy-6-metoxy-1,4-benzoquinol methylase